MRQQPVLAAAATSRIVRGVQSWSAPMTHSTLHACSSVLPGCGQQRHSCRHVVPIAMTRQCWRLRHALSCAVLRCELASGFVSARAVIQRVGAREGKGVGHTAALRGSGLHMFSGHAQANPHVFDVGSYQSSQGPLSVKASVQLLAVSLTGPGWGLYLCCCQGAT